MRTGTPLNHSERKLIHKYIHLGWSFGHIAIKLDRGKNTIIAEVNRNGGRIEYNPEKAELRAKEQKNKRIEKLRMSTKENYTQSQTVDQKLENMQMQIDIILDELKKLKDKK